MKNPGQKLNSILLIALLLFAYMVMGQDYSSEVRNNGKKSFHRNTIGQDFKIEYRGDIELTDDDKDIKSMSRDGYLEISKTVFGSRRYVLIESESGNSLYREYREGRTKVDWNPAGKAWLAEILPEIVRTTTLAAESRVNRFYGKGGAESVLSEITRIESDYVKSHYFKLLLSKNGLKSADLAKIAQTAGDEISSDYYLSEVLKKNSRQFFESDQATTAYLNASKEIGSDYYLTVVLKEALGNKDLNSDQIDDLLEASEYISSDYYITTVLKEALEQGEMNSTKIKAIVVQSKNISSDHYQTELINQIIDNEELSKETVEIVIEAISNVGSDYYIYSTLNKILDNEDLEEQATLSIAKRVMTEISSDHYSSEILMKLSKSNLSDEGLNRVIEGTLELHSDFYMSKVIKSLASRDMTDQQLISILKAAKEIDSDFYLSEVLVGLAENVSGRGSVVKDAYREAAEDISSETYFGKAMRALRN